MSQVSISELKANLSKYIREVRRGRQLIQVRDLGSPVAWLKPITEPDPNLDTDADLRAQLIRDGILTPGSGNSSDILSTPPIKLRTSILEALLEDRL